MRRWFALAALIAAALLTAACGTTRTITTTVTATTTPGASSSAAPVPAVLQPAASCPAGRSFMGCSVVKTTKPGLTLAGIPSGARFPDVSSYQGHPDWKAARASIAGAVAKLGEGVSVFDSSATYNVAQLKALKIPFAVYWFVRPDGCAGEGNAIKAAVSRVGGVPLVVLDEEVPGVSGYAACLNPAVVAATGKNAVVYRSSGNDYDASASSLRCWVAAYGPSSAPPCSGRTRVAWQMTDGRYGFPIYIPGVGQGDVSVDEGFLALAKPKPTPTPSRHHDWLPNARRAFHVKGHTVHARERLAVTQWDGHGCRNPVKRKACRTLRKHMQLLAGRISFIAHHTGRHLKHRARKPRWGAIHYRAGKHRTTLGGAYQQFVRRLSNKHHGVVTHW